MSKSKKHPNLYIIAGPNGSGKTTFAKEFLPRFVKCPFVNADLIAQGFAPFEPETVALKAGRLFLQEIHSLAKEKVDFSFETTLSGKSYISFLKKIKKQGYKIHLFLLWIPSVQLSFARIKDRVSRGGHNIPRQDVLRRYGRIYTNFFQSYKNLADIWMIYDNSTSISRLIAREENGKLGIQDEVIYKEILKFK